MPPDFAAEGLLDGLEGDARAARQRLLTRLHDDGATLEELKAACDEDRLLLLPAERLIGGRAALHRCARSPERTGLDLEFLRALRRANGLPVPEADAHRLHRGRPRGLADGQDVPQRGGARRRHARHHPRARAAASPRPPSSCAT